MGTSRDGRSRRRGVSRATAAPRLRRCADLARTAAVAGPQRVHGCRDRVAPQPGAPRRPDRCLSGSGARTDAPRGILAALLSGRPDVPARAGEGDELIIYLLPE